MGRPKIYLTPADRYSAYRERTAQARDRLNELGLQAQGHIQPEAPTEKNWFSVELTFDRKGMEKPAIIQYVMTETELLRLQNDLHAFKKDGAIDSGIYAFADHNGSGVPGTFAIAFEGVTVTGTRLLPDFSPMSCYSITEGMIQLLLNQRPRPYKAVQ